MRSVDSRPDVGLADVDFGPGPVTMTALCGLDPDELVAAANAEAVGLWHELAAFCLARAARHAAALTDQHGGPSDPVAAFEAERAADLTAARAESDPLARAAGIALASGGDGTDPARAFPEWEKDVLAARLGISTGQAKGCAARRSRSATGSLPPPGPCPPARSAGRTPTGSPNTPATSMATSALAWNARCSPTGAS